MKLIYTFSSDCAMFSIVTVMFKFLVFTFALFCYYLWGFVLRTLYACDSKFELFSSQTSHRQIERFRPRIFQHTSQIN